MIVNYYKLVSDNDYLPKLKVIDHLEYKGDEKNLIFFEHFLPVFSALTEVRREQSENLYMIGYDYNNVINGIYHLSMGHIKKVEIPIRSIFTCLVLSNSYGFKMLHNHVIKNANPSGDDLASCELFKTIAQYMECEYYGHYIITKEKGYCIEDEEEYIFDEDE